MKFLLPCGFRTRPSFLAQRMPSTTGSGFGVALAQTDGVSKVMFNGLHSSGLRLICFVTGVLVLLSIAACRRGAPVFDPSPRPAQADGTISGTVRGPEGTSSIEGRDVTVVNVDTGVRAQVKTNNAGGFTFKVKPGKYRVELVLLAGETLVKQPGVINVNRSDVDAHADFVVGNSRIARPRFASPRAADGLGSPSA